MPMKKATPPPTRTNSATVEDKKRKTRTFTSCLFLYNLREGRAKALVAEFGVRSWMAPCREGKEAT
jgi:hypothetical protein